MKKRIINFTKYLWITGTVFFVAYYFYTHFESIEKILILLPPINIFIAIFSLLLTKFFLSFVASLSIQYFDEKITFSEMFIIYNITQLAKYIPGSIWQFVGKASYYSQKDINFSTIKKSIFLEMLWVFGSAFIVGVVMITVIKASSFSNFYAILQEYHFVYILIFLCVLSIGYFRKIILITNILIVNWLLSLKMILNLLIVWFLLGMTFFITLEPYIQSINFQTYFFIVGVYALAYAIGFLIPFAPAGIGIRESILVSTTISFLPIEYAIVLASLNRMLYIITEVLIVLLIYLFKYFKRVKPE